MIRTILEARKVSAENVANSDSQLWALCGRYCDATFVSDTVSLTVLDGHKFCFRADCYRSSHTCLFDSVSFEWFNSRYSDYFVDIAELNDYNG